MKYDYAWMYYRTQKLPRSHLSLNFVTMEDNGPQLYTLPPNRLLISNFIYTLI